MPVNYVSGACKREQLLQLNEKELIELHNEIARDGVAAGLDPNRYKPTYITN
jgi:hypothetical protein